MALARGWRPARICSISAAFAGRSKLAAGYKALKRSSPAASACSGPFAVSHREFVRFRHNFKEPLPPENLEEDVIDVDDDFDDTVHVNAAQRRQAERLWDEIMPLTINKLWPVVKMWVKDDKQLGLPGILYVVAKLRSFRRFKQALSIVDWLADEKAFGEFDEKLHRLHVWLAFEGENLGLAEDVFFRRLPPEMRTEKLKAAMVAGYCMRNNLLRAEQLIQTYKLKSAEPYTGLLRLYLRTGSYDKASSLYKQMRADNVQANIAAFASILRHKENMETMEEVGKDADECLRAIGAYDEDLKLKESVASYAMVVFGYLKKEADAARMWEYIKQRDPIAEGSYLNAIDAFGALGKVRPAEEAADNMELTRHGYLRLSCAMIRLYSRLNMMSKAEKVLQELRDNGVWIPFPPYGELIMGYLSHNQPDQAMNALKKALLVKLTKPSYIVILKMLPVFEKLRDAEGAEDMVRRYKGFTDLRVYKGLLRVYIAARLKPLEEFEARLILKEVTPDEELERLMRKLKQVVG